MAATNKFWAQYFKTGERVQLHPATDWWMRGARYGAVVKTTSKSIHVKLDANDRVVRLSGDLLEHV